MIGDVDDYFWILEFRGWGTVENKKAENID